MGHSAVAERYANASEETRHQIDSLLAQDADDQAWVEQLGPAYRQAHVARLLGKSKQAVSADAGLLKLVLRNGDIGYPVFQFDGRRQLPGVRDVIAELAPVVATPWTIASWLMTPSPDLGDRTPVAALRQDDVAGVLGLAHRFARALAA